MNNAFSPQQPQPQGPDKFQQLMSVISLFHPDELQRLLPLVMGHVQTPNVDTVRNQVDQQETTQNMQNMLNRGMTAAPGFNAMTPPEYMAPAAPPLSDPNSAQSNAELGGRTYSVSGPLKRKTTGR